MYTTILFLTILKLNVNEKPFSGDALLINVYF